jgi:hypothetical protein
MSESNANELNAKLLALLDREEIKAIPHRFARGLDRCDRSLIESCFHPEGVDDHGFFKAGATEFCDWVMGELTKFDASQHIIATQNVEVSGSKAACESYFVAFHVMQTPEGSKELIVAGRYLDEMEKHDGEWKIKLRKCVFDWNRMTEASPAPSRDPDPRYLGKNYPDDDSYGIFSRLR